jgi:RHS repeat-associated protein
VTQQTLNNNATGETVLTASIGYDPMYRRISRTVTAIDEGSGSSTTAYWYGNALVPLVVERDGKTYRMIGGIAIEERTGNGAGAQYYPHRDYTTSVRVVTDGTGVVAASLGYDGDWGITRIQGQDDVTSDSGMEAFYRFQSHEAEIFPLAALNITDGSLGAWLDELQLYHFPYREYSAGLAIFMSQDPARQSVSPYSAFGANPANIGDPSGAIDTPFWEKSWFQEGLFTAVWGGTTVAVAYFGGGSFGTNFEPAVKLASLSIGRFVGLTVLNLLRSSTWSTGNERELRILRTTSGVAKLRYSTDHPSRSFMNLVQQEGVEALFSGIASNVVERYTGLTKVNMYAASTGAAFGAMVGVDIAWAGVRDRIGETEAWGYILDVDHAYSSVWVARGMNVIFALRSAALDVTFFGSMAVLWYYAVDKGSLQYVAGSLWFLRNVGARAAKDAVVTLYKEISCQSCARLRFKRPLINFQPGDDGNIYAGWSDNAAVTFVWNYATGPRQIQLDNILRFKMTHPGLAKDVAQYRGQSWEQLSTNDNLLQVQNNQAIRRHSVSFAPRADANENENKNGNEE